jgi:hypothetical protein
MDAHQERARAGRGHDPDAGALRLRNALQASDLPDSAAALVGPLKSVVLQHRKHRTGRVSEARESIFAGGLVSIVGFQQGTIRRDPLP